MVPRDKPDNAVSRESSSTSHVASQYDIPEENIYISISIYIYAHTHPLVIKQAGLDGKILELHGGFSSHVWVPDIKTWDPCLPPTDKHIYIYVTYLDIPCHMISYMITHVISYASKIYAHYTYMHYITLHIIYCALHYSTLHYSTLHVYITTYWLVVSTPLKILVSWEYYFQHMGK